MRASMIRGLALAALVVLTGTASAVTREDLSLAERQWTANRKDAAMVTLADRVSDLERTGQADDPRSVTRLYWMHANAQLRHARNCAAADLSLQKATLLGFQTMWPDRSRQYADVSSELTKCLGTVQRVRIQADALQELQASPFHGLTPKLATPEPAQAAAKAADANHADVATAAAAAVPSSAAGSARTGSLSNPPSAPSEEAVAAERRAAHLRAMAPFAIVVDRVLSSLDFYVTLRDAVLDGLRLEKSAIEQYSVVYLFGLFLLLSTALSVGSAALRLVVDGIVSPMLGSASARDHSPMARESAGARHDKARAKRITRMNPWG